MDTANLANMLGAFAVELSDKLRGALAAAGHDVSTGAALVHLSKYPGETIDHLRTPLELSHSGCVRLVDRLETAGLVERKGATDDARAVAVQLTRKGRDAAELILRRREEVLAGALSTLTAKDREQLARMLARILPAEVPTGAAALRACRLCDYGACRECPLSRG
ncbi:MAG TPA: MarR family transcriptional regulator [Kofleriaceae bacterium]|nr:MarR family transcriptional regulator [Kofleriaceae bacterium]